MINILSFPRRRESIAPQECVSNYMLSKKHSARQWIPAYAGMTVKTVFAGLLFLSLTGFSVEQRNDLKDPGLSQPPEERAAQDKLPKSKDNLWNDFSKCKVTLIEDNKLDIYQYGITYTPEVKAMVGKEITISGFMLPLESTEKFQHFILSKRTPTCPFCPPGQPNEIVDVYTDKPIAWDENLIKVKGMFEFTNDQKLGMFFKLSKATVN